MSDADRHDRPRIELKYRWKRDRQVSYLERYFGWDGRWRIGMVEKTTMGSYEWFVLLSEYEHGPTLRPASGLSETPRMAAMACEECVDRQLVGEWPALTEQEREIAISLAKRPGRQGDPANSESDAQ